MSPMSESERKRIAIQKGEPMYPKPADAEEITGEREWQAAFNDPRSPQLLERLAAKALGKGAMTIEEIVEREVARQGVSPAGNFHGEMPVMPENRVGAFGLAVAKAVVEECAKIAAKHRAPERKPVSRVFREEIGHEIVMEIQAEERGERIAAECIAKEIRAWNP